MRLGPWELGIILAIVLIIFGVGKLPQVGGAVGKAMKEFRKGQQDSLDETAQDASTQPISDSEKKESS